MTPVRPARYDTNLGAKNACGCRAELAFAPDDGSTAW
jgi:hypothetical protein